MSSSQKKIPAEAKVGLFVVLIIIGLAVITTKISDTGISLKDLHTYDIYFNNVSGLLERTPVEYNGIRVGWIKSIKMAQEGGKRVKVTIEVSPEVKIFEDSRVGLETRGLLGEKIVMIQGGGDAPPIPPGGAIFDAIDGGGFEDAMADFSEISETLKDFLKGGQGKPSIADVIENTTAITENMRGILESREGDIDAIVRNVKDVSNAMKEFMASEDPNQPNGLQDLRSTLARLDETVTSLQQMVARVERGEGTVGKLLNDETTINKANDALDGLNEFVGSIKELEIGIGFRGEYMSTAGEPVAITSFRFRPAYDKYFLFEFTDGPLSFSNLSKERTTTETTPPGTQVTEVTETRSSSFTLTAIFARRFYDFTMKAGLFRSSGYFGGEYHLFRDRFSLSLDAFNFDRSENPQLRAFATYHFFNVFQLRAGVDDLINEDGPKNYFAGLGFMLTDDDLKRLFGVAPLFAQ